jgi:6-pyruvoyltetrahydropterin/6-carboxytetrahydropterin synthase
MGDRILYTASTSFEAARRLTLGGDPAAAAGIGSGLHGHGFLATVWAPAPDTGAASWAPFPGGEVDALRERLQAGVAPLDYQLLNDHLALPSDENLAHWIAARLALDAGVQVGVQSTRRQGTDVDDRGIAHEWRRFHFEAAHRLPRVAAGHKCGRMHGHGFAVLLQVTGADARSLDRLWAPLQAQLHHACLNDIPGLENPTSERIASWIWERLQPQLEALSWVTVYETATCGAHFDGVRYRIWKEMGFDSAVRLAQAPAGDARSRVHGHSYRLRLHLTAALDAVLGWTIDFGDVKEIFAPVFARLDHHPLHELPGVAQTGALGIVRWARDQAASALPQLDRIDLYETSGCGVALSWGAQQPVLPV